MSVDKNLNREPEQESQVLDAILADEPGLLGRFSGTFKTSMRLWMVWVVIATILASACLLFSGYQFYIANEISSQIFWGVWFIVSLIIQAMLKLWTFMEMNRVSNARELKRIELSLERLEARLQRT